MGKHSEWRKLAKKILRKRKRRAAALIKIKEKEAEKHKQESNPYFKKWFEEQQQLEEYQTAEEIRISKEQHKQFLEREQIAQKKWQELQQKLQLARQARVAQNIRIKEEWEAEQKRLNELKVKKEREEEQRVQNEQRLQQQIDEFVNNSGDMPPELNQMLESNPGKIICPFFSRTGACRFGDLCSRNHIRATISTVLLIKNFYSHYSLEARENEHGDSSLEFDNHELYQHYELFFNDVVPEFESFGTIYQFRVCCNKEAHLRGNVYVAYYDCRQAMRSFRRFHGRYYAGRQLNVEFCKIESWRSAMCGLFYKKGCPKGSVCNFLHVFRNPGNLYTKLDFESRSTHKAKTDDWNGSERRNWRWSSSPEILDEKEPEVPKNHRNSTVYRYRSPVRKNRNKRKKDRDRSKSRGKRNKRHGRSRSRSKRIKYDTDYTHRKSARR